MNTRHTSTHNSPELQNQQSGMLPPAKGKKSPPPPKTCLLVIGLPSGRPYEYRYRATGFFPSKRAAKARLAEIQAAQARQGRVCLYLLLTDRDNPVYAQMAAQLMPSENTRATAHALNTAALIAAVAQIPKAEPQPKPVNGQRGYRRSKGRAEAKHPIDGDLADLDV